jgi:hypothetical protein
MQIDQRSKRLMGAALAALSMLVQVPAGAAVSGGEAGSTFAAGPAETARDTKAEPATKAKVNSKSPYAAWRARREQAEKPDTSGHGHRAPRPEGQSRSRKLP